MKIKTIFAFALASIIGSLAHAATYAIKPGVVNNVPAGTFDFAPGVVELPSSTSLIGVAGQTIFNCPGGPNGEAFHISGDNETIDGITFNGAGIHCDKPLGRNVNIVINNCVIIQNSHGGNCHGVSFTSGLQDAKITNSLFTGYNGGFGLYGYNPLRLTVANNEFVNVVAAAHIDSQAADCADFLAEQNYISGAKGMGLEFQGFCNRCTVQDNWFENPNLSTTYDTNNNSMAFSIPMDKGFNTIIRRNYINAPQRPDGTGCRIGFEVGGDNTLVDDNYVDGINVAIGDTDGVGTSSVTATNNHISNALSTTQFAFPGAGRTFSQSNNGPNVVTTWNPATRGKPQRNHRYGTATTTSTTPTPSPTAKAFSITATPASTIVNEKATATIATANVPTGAVKFTGSMVASGNALDARGLVKDLSLNVGDAIVISGPYGYAENVTLNAIDSTGKTLATATASSVQFASDATHTSITPWPVAIAATPTPTTTPTTQPAATFPLTISGQITIGADGQITGKVSR